MELNRRDFIKASGAGLGGLFLFGALNDDVIMARTLKKVPLKKQIGETTTISPYCGVGCSLLMTVENGEILHIEGDPDSPINEGSLCSKGASLYQLANNEERMTTAKYRSPGASNWTNVSWGSTIYSIAEKIKSTRDTNWKEKDGNGNTVNRTEAIASIGSVFLNSEEAYLLSKMLRSLGLVYIENEARICVSAAVAADTETVGRGPMSNHWIDLGNSDCIMVIGGNMAESFPVAFKWVTRAQDKGAKLIHVDTRFTRTSAKCDLYAQVALSYLLPSHPENNPSSVSAGPVKSGLTR